MSRVNTVLGPIPAEELGLVAIHEHIGQHRPDREPDSTWPETLEQRYVETIPTLRRFREYGGETLVEATGIRVSRDVDYYRSLSARTGVLIVASTGFDCGAACPPFFAQASVDNLTQYFTHEITIGIDHTGIRAGFITAGASHPTRMTDLDTRIHRAAARAAVATGVPLLTRLTSDVEPAIAIFHEEGLPLHRVLFAHTDNHMRNDNLHVQSTRDIWIAEQGGRIGLNTLDPILGRETKPEDPRLVARPPSKCRDRLLRFIHAGHLYRALATIHTHRGPLETPDINGHTMDHIFTDLIPGLRHAGLPQATITTLFIDNPANFLAIQN